MNCLQDQNILEGTLTAVSKERSKCRVIVTKYSLTCRYDDNGTNDDTNEINKIYNQRNGNQQNHAFNSWSPHQENDGNKNVTNNQLRNSFMRSNSMTKCGQEVVLNVDDIVGCDCTVATGQLVEGPTRTSDACLTVFAYPPRSGTTGKPTVRSRKTLSFLFNRSNSFEKNFNEASAWQQVIQNLARNTSIASHMDALTPLDLRQLLVIINPFSGRSKAEQTYRDVVEPMLNDAGIKHHVLLTAEAGHAMHYVHNTCIDNWSGIVVISGDGMIHEIINGLMRRRDWRSAIETPLGIVPAGSGNALSSSILHANGASYTENWEVQATFEVLKQRPAPLDLLSVDLGSGRRLYSFLQIAWGLVSDVDIESERYRSIGSARLTICAIIRIANLRRYRGRVSFLPVDPNCKPKRPFTRGVADLQNSNSAKDLHNVQQRNASDESEYRSFQRQISSMSESSDHSDNEELMNDNSSINDIFYDAEKLSDQFLDVDSINQWEDAENESIKDGILRLELENNNDINDQISMNKRISIKQQADTRSLDEYWNRNINKKSLSMKYKFDTRSLNENLKNIQNFNTDKISQQDNDVETKNEQQKMLEEANRVNNQNKMENRVENDFFHEGMDGNVEKHSNQRESSHQIQRKYLPKSFEDPVPEDWITMEEDFVSIIANMHTHASRDLIFAPEARADDGCIHLLLAYNGLSRLDLIRLLSDGDISRLAAGSNLEVIKVKAFRIVPLTPGEIMTVDGERVEYGPIQAEVLPSLGRVMTSRDSKNSPTAK